MPVEQTDRQPDFPETPNANDEDFPFCPSVFRKRVQIGHKSRVRYRGYNF